MRLIIDRFEEETAIVELENGETIPLPATLFQPLNAKEGDVLQLYIDKAETTQRRERVASLLKNLFQE